MSNRHFFKRFWQVIMSDTKNWRKISVCPTRQKFLETEDKITTSTQELWIDKNLNNFIKQAIIFPRSKIQEQFNLILGKCLLRDQSVLAIGAPHHKKASPPELRYKAARGLKLYEKLPHITHSLCTTVFFTALFFTYRDIYIYIYLYPILIHKSSFT